jgi:predicted xylan-binding protein with Ca-dependent carbohydrate-binding module
MRICSFPVAVVLLLLFLLAARPVAGVEGDSISVDLKTFKFKVRDEIQNLFGYDEGESRLFFYANGAGETTVKIPADGDYEIAIKASCDPAQDERAKFKISIDGEPLGKETLLTADGPKDYKQTAKLKAGDPKLVIEFTNDVYKENEYDRNLFIHAVTLTRAK